MNLEEFLASCVFVDLETTRHGRLKQIGAFCGERVFQHTSRSSAQQALQALDALVRSTGARFVAGHNLLGHDWQFIRAAAPKLQMLDLPVVDTLYLSPLAFPENPYHSLVKDYKLVRDSFNDPVADARLCERVLRDTWDEFAGPVRGGADRLSLYRFCFARDVVTQDGPLPTAGLVRFFELLGARPIDEAAAQQIFEQIAAGRTCCSAARDLIRTLEPGFRRAALAYCAAWLPVAGGNSVLPRWVRFRFPEVVQVIRRLRDQPCNDPACDYCREVHDPRAQLQRYFGFEAFRPLPSAPDGSSLQEAIVRRGMADQPLLAILPTGGGKSLCFQLPAIVRNVRRGVLTVVISPLQALMKDQVDNLIARTGCPAAALSGLLTPPERGQVLEQVRMGDVGLLYVSPEQLRNQSTIAAIQQREIGCWVFDEAHCLSKWGHDFRPDYLYAARFVRELAQRQGTPIPPIACFTATAKRDVTEEIVRHFQQELGQDLQVFEGGIERDNLRFEVQPIESREKYPRVHELLSERLRDSGAALVYAATRRTAEELAQYLQQQGWLAAAFHAGLKPPQKREVQDAFIRGDVRVICATNAFGMGIDKEDVRMVVHADTPGSLENYLQEAGRAGRDRQPAECVLLYGPDDVETQFGLAALSELNRRDIAQILRGLRRAGRKQEVLVITAGELLQDEDVNTSFDSAEPMADTKVRTAVAWLERAGFLQRDQNATSVFQGKPRLRSLAEAEAKIDRLGLSDQARRRWIEVLHALLNTDGPEGLSADRLAELPAFRDQALGVPSPAGRGPSEVPSSVGRGQGEDADGEAAPTATQQVLRTLDEMAAAGLIEQGAQLSAFVRHKVEDSSLQRLRAASQVEEALLKLMQEQEPDAASEDQPWIALSLRRLNQTLVDQGLPSSTEMLRRLLSSLRMDGRGFAGSHGSLEFRHHRGDHYRVKVRRGWPALGELSRKRREIAEVVLRTILDKVPREASASAGLLVEFSCDELTQAVRRDLALQGQVKDVMAAVDRGLMYLHEQQAIILQHGLSVFRQAMTIRLTPEAKGRRYTLGDFDPLARHYDERVLQVHVMCEYARRGIQSIRDGLQLVLAYFTEPRADFIARYFGDRQDALRRRISAEGYQQIVDDLHNPVQQAVVAAPEDDNLLILAGPGSGKTRAIVHRVAYLVRVQRHRPESVLVLCFNRLAAIQLKRRLRELIGKAAGKVTVLTYHGLAARLTGTSFAESVRRDQSRTGTLARHEQSTAGTLARHEEPDGQECPSYTLLADLIPAATRILRGQQPLPGLAADEVRDRLLSGYRFVLVDEYQDIDQPQYELISALTDRTGKDADAKLSILAVGDDDQNIYAFRGTNVEFIRRFQQDYRAASHYLLENYRSTAYIIAAANQLIRHNRDRMKTQHDIRIHAARAADPPGGPWQARDPLVQGRVQILHVADARGEAAAVVAELQRLQALDPALDWADCAVLGRTHEALYPIRAACEHAGIPVVWGLQRTPGLHRVREIARLLDELERRRDEARSASELLAEFALDPNDRNPWRAQLAALLTDWQDETAGERLPASQLIEFLFDALAEQRREQRLGQGVFLSTVHAAKGTEFDHVIIPHTGWTARAEEAAREEERRLYYVAMTRARQTLCLLTAGPAPHPHARLLSGDGVLLREAPPCEPLPDAVRGRRYELLGLDDIDLGYAGSRPEHHPIHEALARLQPGSILRLMPRPQSLVLLDSHGVPVARLSRAGSDRWRVRLDQVVEARVIAMLVRKQSDEQPEFRARCRCQQWEVPLVEIVCVGRAGATRSLSQTVDELLT